MIETEIQLADGGYGQGQVLMNPIHPGGLYTMFPNRRCHKPYIAYRKEAGIGSMAEVPVLLRLRKQSIPL